MQCSHSFFNLQGISHEIWLTSKKIEMKIRPTLKFLFQIFQERKNWLLKMSDLISTLPEEQVGVLKEKFDEYAGKISTLPINETSCGQSCFSIQVQITENNPIKLFSQFKNYISAHRTHYFIPVWWISIRLLLVGEDPPWLTLSHLWLTLPEIWLAFHACYLTYYLLYKMMFQRKDQSIQLS